MNVSDYRLAAHAVRNGKDRPDGLSDAQWAALLLAESPDQKWRAMRGQAGITAVRRALSDAWSWEVADAYNGPTRVGGAVKTLFTPNGQCGYCGRRLFGEQLTFCNHECRMYYVRRAARGGVPRVCRADGCDEQLSDEYAGAYCGDCQAARRAADMQVDEVRWQRPCKTDGCDNMTAWEGMGRPPDYCFECNDPARLARERKRRERARKRAAS